MCDLGVLLLISYLILKISYPVFKLLGLPILLLIQSGQPRLNLCAIISAAGKVPLQVFNHHLLVNILLNLLGNGLQKELRGRLTLGRPKIGVVGYDPVQDDV